MVSYNNQFFHGERSLFGQENATIVKTTFGKGESPLKESRNIKLDQSIFLYKYPLWYSQHITVANTIFETMARSGIWYTNDITMSDSAIQAPKTFRRSQNIRLKNVHFSDASESLWNCNHISFDHVQASGNYIGMNSTNI
ncbi:hydrogenase, partial [Lacticaseibacillus rhamnosus]